MILVVDASIVAALAFPDERPAEAIAAADVMAVATTIAPKLFWYEIHAIGLKMERRGVMSSRQVDDAFRFIGALPIDAVEPDDSADVIALARRHMLTFYDAAYLALALAKNAKLATLDSALAIAARKEGVLLGA